jgi:orotate phosphoribosyltransferase
MNPGNPFTWASGWKSPIYCDNIILSFPPIRNYVRDEFSKLLKKQFEMMLFWCCHWAIELECLLLKVWVTFVYVRQKQKTRSDGISRRFLTGQNVVVEDLIVQELAV